MGQPTFLHPRQVALEPRAEPPDRIFPGPPPEMNRQPGRRQAPEFLRRPVDHPVHPHQLSKQRKERRVRRHSEPEQPLEVFAIKLEVAGIMEIAEAPLAYIEVGEDDR